jgi:hypothetical protein
MMQKGFFIELKQNPYTTKVTALPPSFDWNKKYVLRSLLYYKCKTEIGNWQGAPTLYGPIYSSSKRLKTTIPLGHNTLKMIKVG